MIRYFLLGIVIISFFSKAKAEAPTRLILELGDFTRLSIPQGTSLHLSQKKILDLNDEGAGHYQIIALRSGIVFARAVDAQGQTLQTWLIEVLPKASEGRADILHHPRWRAMLCEESGIICDRESLRGQSESLPWLHKARELCLKHPPCRWQAELSRGAQEHWAGRLAQELSLPLVRVGVDGFVSLHMDCQNPDSKREEQLRRWLLDRYAAPSQVFCEARSSEHMSMEVLAIAHKSSDSSLSNPLQIGALRLLPSQPVEVFLRGLAMSRDTKILAQPHVAVNLGGSIELSDGIEFASTTVQHDQSIETWKQVGFQLQVKLLEQRSQQLRVQLSLQLSRPQEGQRSLDRSSLLTETWLDLDQLQLLGHIEAETDGFEESRIPWLSEIPLLGAFFRWRTQSLGKSQVYLLLRIKRQSLATPSSVDLEAHSPEKT